MGWNGVYGGEAENSRFKVLRRAGADVPAPADRRYMSQQNKAVHREPRMRCLCPIDLRLAPQGAVQS